MYLEFMPDDAPDPADPDVQFGVAPEQITTELLELCEEFFRHASPAVHGELSQFLTEHVHTAISGNSSTHLASPPSTAPNGLWSRPSQESGDAAAGSSSRSSTVTMSPTSKPSMSAANPGLAMYAVVTSMGSAPSG